MSVLKRLETLDHLSELIVNMHDSVVRLKSMCDTNHGKLLFLHHETKRVYCRLQVDKRNLASETLSPEQEVEELKLQLRTRDEEMKALQEERDDYMAEVEQLNDAFLVISEDHVTLENTIRENDELQSQLHTLNEEVVLRNNVISRLQIENSRIKAESGRLLEEFAQAIQDDEQLYANER